MADALVGDSLFDEDPTVTRLEASAAKALGKEAALFVPSGSMGNIVAILALTKGRGCEIVADRSAHILNHESGSISRIAGCHLWPLDTDRGVFGPQALDDALRPGFFVYPETGLVSIENTVNDLGGGHWRADEVRALGEHARALGLPMHCDGARIWHAAVAQDTTPDRLTGACDTVMACFSKGLSAPVGSIVAGDEETIRRAVRERKMVGGAMRQAGVVAAAAQVALDSMVDRLADDHARAGRIAHALADAGYGCDPARHPTNIVVADTAPLGLDARTLCDRLATEGVLALPMGPTKVRFVTHRHVTDEKTALACETLAAVAAKVA